MTNTAGLTPDQAIQIRNSYRRDESFVRALATEPGVTRRFNILQVGRFDAGTGGTYAAIEVLRHVGGVQAFVVHTLLRIDDRPDVEWDLYAGHYFSSLRAALDYLER